MNTILKLAMIGLLTTISLGCAAQPKGFAAIGPGPVNPLTNPIGANQAILELESGANSNWVTTQAAKQASAAEAKTFSKPVNNSFDLK